MTSKMNESDALMNEKAAKRLASLVAEAAAVQDGGHPFSTKPFTPDELSTLPPRSGHWKPMYLICMTARTGSTMLCSVLERTGLVGVPDEYVNPRGPFPMYYEQVGSGDLRTYFHRVWERNAGPGGIFGIKTPFQDISHFVQSGLFDVVSVRQHDLPIAGQFVRASRFGVDCVRPGLAQASRRTSCCQRGADV
jgi:hypothetical protein